MINIFETVSSVRITAVQFCGLNIDEIKEFVGENFVTVEGYPYILNNGDMLKVSAGDYVIKGTKGEFYPCPKDVMNEKYRKCGEVHEVKSNFISHKDACIYVEKETGLYPDGAHTFRFRNCVGWDNENQKTGFVETWQTIRYVRKDENGKLIEGVTSEQQLISLIHRHTQLNKAFPCAENDEFISYLQSALNLLEHRVKDRIDRGVMGELKK